MRKWLLALLFAFSEDVFLGAVLSEDPAIRQFRTPLRNLFGPGARSLPVHVTHVILSPVRWEPKSPTKERKRTEQAGPSCL